MMEGESLMVLLANEPPSNGTCTVQPQAGVTLETKFWFSCRDWQDMDNSDAPFVNWVRVQNTDGTLATLYRGIQSNISMYLPVGRTYKQRDVRLQVLVEDTFGAIAIGLDRYFLFTDKNLRAKGSAHAHPRIFPQVLETFL